MNKIPKKEIEWVRVKRKGKEQYVITSNSDKNLFYLYEISDEGYSKISKAKNPLVFDEIMFGGD